MIQWRPMIYCRFLIFCEYSTPRFSCFSSNRENIVSQRPNVYHNILALRDEVGGSLCNIPGVGVGGRTWLGFLLQVMYLSYLSYLHQTCYVWYNFNITTKNNTIVLAILLVHTFFRKS